MSGTMKHAAGESAAPPNPPEERHYCGVDLHKDSMQVCVVSAAGEEKFNRPVRACGDAFLDLIGPYRDGLEVAVGSTAGWYWLADLCLENDLPFALIDARKAMTLVPRKSDSTDARRLAELLRLQHPPLAYACPRGYRGVRDAVRVRTRAVRERAKEVTRLKGVYAAYNVGLTAPMGGLVEEAGVYLSALKDRPTRLVAEHHIDEIAWRDERIGEFEAEVLGLVKGQHAEVVKLLRTVPGVGPVLSAVIACEVIDVARFPDAGRLRSYAGLVVHEKQSNGTRLGASPRKGCNTHLNWAFNQAAGGFVKQLPAVAAWAHARSGVPAKKVRAVLSSRIAQAVHAMWKQSRPFDAGRFVNALPPLDREFNRRPDTACRMEGRR